MEPRRDLCFVPEVLVPALDWRLFAPFRRLVRVRFGERVYRLPENNSLLRGLQFLDPSSLDYGNFCWNGDCHTCEVRVLSPEGESAALACSTEARDGLTLAAPPAGVRLPAPGDVVVWDDIDDAGNVRSAGDRDRP